MLTSLISALKTYLHEEDEDEDEEKVLELGYISAWAALRIQRISASMAPCVKPSTIEMKGSDVRISERRRKQEEQRK